MHPVAQILIKWYNQNKRDLPWRNTRNPYHIWLSEIILQQTRVDQGKPYYFHFIEKYPDIKTLSKASEQSILKSWEGLGYYSRARNLHQTAKIIEDQYSGVFPDSYNELIKLKGIGPYTAAAIASFSFNEAKPVIDGNVFRVLSRIFDIEADIADAKNRKIFENTANEILPKSKSAIFNQSIMEFGALQCSPIPKCENCPASLQCYAFINKKQQELPVKTKKTKVKILYYNYLVIENENHFYLKKRTDNDIWKGLYDFESIISETPLKLSEIREIINNRLTNFEIINQSKIYKHLLSHRKIFATFFHIKTTDKIDNCFAKEEIEQLPKPVLIINYLNDYIF